MEFVPPAQAESYAGVGVFGAVLPCASHVDAFLVTGNDGEGF
jgi:hypothetical protein